MVNLIVNEDNYDDEDGMRKIVEDGRVKGGFNHICSFFGQYKTNTVSFTDGINFFSIENKTITNVLQFYYIHINNAAIKKARMTL